MKVRRFKLTENDTERKGEEKGKGSKENRIESSETDKLMKEKKKHVFNHSLYVWILRLLFNRQWPRRGKKNRPMFLQVSSPQSLLQLCSSCWHTLYAIYRVILYAFEASYNSSNLTH